MNQVQTNNLIRISKRKAKQLYNQNKSVYFIGHKLHPENMYMPAYKTNKSELIEKYGDMLETDFDYLVNHYQWYNCNYETGYYCAFYMLKG